MRIIDDIPESELIELFLGKYQHRLDKSSMLVFSPSFGSYRNLTVYQRYGKELGIRIYYSNSVKKIRIALKWSDPGTRNLGHDGWYTTERYDVPVADPDGPQKVQEHIRGFLARSNLDI